MLQQILQDMWVHPDILAELDESQKQTLFCKMRAEQVRRWKLWDQKMEEEDEKRKLKAKSRGNKKQVQFLLGEDGEPWVWVMGEHPNDKSIEQILEEEAREAARLLAEKETEQLRLSVEAELTELIDRNKKQIEAMEAVNTPPTEDIYCSASEIKERIKVPVSSVVDRRDALQEISLNKPHKVSQRVAMWEKRVMEERTSEIFKGLQKKKLEEAKEAEEAEREHERCWREQERKAKEAEQQIREIARIAREEHRRTSVLNMDTDTPPQSPASPVEGQGSSTEHLEFAGPKPPSKDAIVEWFRSSEVARRAGLEADRNVVAPWFHGLITRQDAEALLVNEPVGCFLVRISERIWGYAISYRDTDRCKHYLVDASNGHYQFLGTNQIVHDTLGELVMYHKTHPITVLGGEILGIPCHRIAQLPAIFEGLIATWMRIVAKLSSQRLLAGLADRRVHLGGVPPHKVSQRVAMWEKRVMEERTSEIFKGLQKKKLEEAKEAEEAEREHERCWREQERKAKEAEQQIREIARIAREEHRRTSVLNMDTDTPPQSPASPVEGQGSSTEHLEFAGPKPPSKDAIVEWFRSSEVARRAGLEADRNVVAPWFHGLITRQDAEALLVNEPVGCFLVRISERIWGYAISYRDTDRCKHYLVDASNGHYQFLGTNQIVHDTLGELVMYHKTHPITVLGGEILGIPCHRIAQLPAIFEGLIGRAR